MPFYNNIGTNYFLVGLFPATNRTPHTIIRRSSRLGNGWRIFWGRRNTPAAPQSIYLHPQEICYFMERRQGTLSRFLRLSDLVDHLPNRLSRSTWLRRTPLQCLKEPLWSLPIPLHGKRPTLLSRRGSRNTLTRASLSTRYLYDARYNRNQST